MTILTSRKDREAIARAVAGVFLIYSGLVALVILVFAIAAIFG